MPLATFQLLNLGLLNTIITLEQAQDFAKRINELFSTPVLVDNIHIKITTSIGIAMFPENGINSEALIKNLETALQHAKYLGGKCEVYFTMEVNKKYQHELELKYALTYALERKEFFLVFQAQYNYKNHEFFGVEALIRWMHLKKLIPPDDFISLTEKSGLITDIGFWVFEEACKAMQRWNKPLMELSINVSLIQMSISDLADRFEVLCKKYAINPRRVTLELTETTLNSELIDIDDVIQKLHKKGFALAIDDFGTGYSSFSRLTKLPITYLKIDKSFVMGVTDNYENSIIIKTILSMSTALGLKVIAEGVSNEDELQFLFENGCELMQGFHFAKPMPLEDMTKLL